MFLLAEGVLFKELEAVPLSRREKRHGRNEEEGVPEFRERKWTLPPSAKKRTEASQAAKARRQKAKRQRKKEESQKKSKKGDDKEENPPGVVLTERKRKPADEEETVSFQSPRQPGLRVAVPESIGLTVEPHLEYLGQKGKGQRPSGVS